MNNSHTAIWARKHLFLLTTAIGLLPAWPAGQVFGQTVAPAAAPNPTELNQRLQALQTSAKHPMWADYMAVLKARSDALCGNKNSGPEELDAMRISVANAGRIATEIAALPADSPWLKAPFIGYVVPAVTAIRRTPDTLPPDGKLENLIIVVAAQDEYEPASFVLAPLQDVAKFEIHPSELRGKAGVIPAESLDLRVVKCWWQPGTAWTSYFADSSHRELVPELLLKDDTLVKVEMAARENYLRVDYPEGPKYVWISYQYPQNPRLEKDIWFDYLIEPCADSETLKPVALKAGCSQQFWLTVKVPAKAAPGIYTGTLTLTADGAPAGFFTLKLRVLPFALPDPRTYYDLASPFYTTMFRLGSLEMEKRGFEKQADAEARLMKQFQNQRAHGLNHYFGTFGDPLKYPDEKNTEKGKLSVRTLELVKEAGFQPPIFDAFSAALSLKYPPATRGTEYTNALVGARMMFDDIEKIVGHREIYAWGAGEPGNSAIKAQLPGWKALQAMGIKVGGEGNPRHLAIAGFAEELVDFGGQDFYERAFTIPWHMIGHRVLCYAGPHPGNENPDVSRRHHGMMLYKACFDGTCNHAWFVGRDNILDFWLPYGYRDLMINQVRGGVLDSLAWEGFREGIDDIRYATLLKQMAAKAIASGQIEAVYAAKKALLWLELLDEKRADLNTMRLEAIRHLLQLQSMLQGIRK